MTHHPDLPAQMMRLWQEQMTRLLHDPKAAEAMAPMLSYWASLMTQPPPMTGAAYAAPPPSSPPAGAAPAAAAFDAGADELQRLARRIDALEKRLAAVEAATSLAPGTGDER